MAEDYSFGGLISVEIDGVRFAPTEADITIMPTNIEVEGRANQDGSGAYTSKPVLPSADVRFRNPSGIKWDEQMRKKNVNATIDETDNNRTHLFSQARITGRPSLNLTTGEIEGIKIEGPNYQKI